MINEIVKNKNVKRIKGKGMKLKKENKRNGEIIV
jgi:hypothetical protein